METTQPLHK